MGYLNKETVTVDAILTKRGRELLAQGKSAFNITQFAVADDEIDYGLYDPAHPLGTEFYGSAIENMPIVEASPNDTQNMKSKLVTFSRSLISQVNVIPTVDLRGVESIVLTGGGSVSVALAPLTSAGSSATQFDGPDKGYTAVLYNSTNENGETVATITATQPITGTTNSQNNSTMQPSNAMVVKGLEFKITAGEVNTVTKTVVVFTGNETGATFTLPVTINPTAS